MLGSRLRREVKATQQAGREFCHCCNGRPESNSETMQKALHHALWESEVGHLAGVSGLLLWGCLSIHQSVRWPRVRHTLGSSRPRRSRRATSDTTARDVRVGDHGGCFFRETVSMAAWLPQLMRLAHCCCGQWSTPSFYHRIGPWRVRRMSWDHPSDRLVFFCVRVRVSMVW